MSDFTRRVALGALAAAAATPLASAPGARAAAPAAGRQVPGIYRYKIGEFELTAINDGAGLRPIQDGFVKNAPLEQVKSALDKAFLPTDKLPIPYTQLIVNTGRRVVLIDTGTGGQLAPTAGMLIENMEAAGLDAKAVDTIIISHFHGDHILGLRTKEGELAFPNAEVQVPEPEWAFWMDEGTASRAPEGLKQNFANAQKVFGPIAKDVKRYEADKELVPGISSVAAYGHTPGHMAFRISSGTDQLLVLSDTSNHPALFVKNPGWHAVFDMDAAKAEDTRRKIFDMASADRTRVQGYHFPFPATGHIAKDGDGYEFVPSAWDPLL
ncbi:MBL fold metallo-hydrolase [Terrihabitans soli]|uniref:MBL fold metallo-hydrolase n=1 Tax=Terrihabitans soli TaxID=708113 RepID=A0A6S6QW64_9HYPH|nr:MBL fold metallo-hydrolase [Terrihabitans soli]BCJ91270.1 MBL fold metallo-hydrolase [Terrihabitans soli]